jgi:hypothetical protein
MASASRALRLARLPAALRGGGAFRPLRPPPGGSAAPLPRARQVPLDAAGDVLAAGLVAELEQLPAQGDDPPRRMRLRALARRHECTAGESRAPRRPPRRDHRRLHQDARQGRRKV